MPILNGTFFMFYIGCTIRQVFESHYNFTFIIRSKYITIFMLYLLFFVMMMLFYLYICNYVTYRGPQGRIAY